MTKQELIQNMYDITLKQDLDYKSQFEDFDEEGNNLANPDNLIPWRCTLFKGDSTNALKSGNQTGTGYGLTEEDAITTAVSNLTTL